MANEVIHLLVELGSQLNPSLRASLPQSAWIIGSHSVHSRVAPEGAGEAVSPLVREYKPSRWEKFYACWRFFNGKLLLSTERYPLFCYIVFLSGNLAPPPPPLGKSWRHPCVHCFHNTLAAIAGRLALRER